MSPDPASDLPDPDLDAIYAPPQSRDEPPVDPAGADARHDPYGPLPLPSYRRFLLGYVLASAGAEMQVVAVGWELYERTNSKANLGFVGLVMVLPVLFLALPAGHAFVNVPATTLIYT